MRRPERETSPVHLEQQTQKVVLLADPGVSLSPIWPDLVDYPVELGPADVVVVWLTRPEAWNAFSQSNHSAHCVVLPGITVEPSEQVTHIDSPEQLPWVLPLVLRQQRLRLEVQRQQRLIPPLSGILGFARLALNTQLNPTQRAYLEGIFSSAQEALARLRPPQPGGQSTRHWGWSSSAGLPGPALRVLVADDNPVSQAMAVLALEEQGHEVALAASGEAVLELVKERSFDLVLMDVNMPVLDGYLTTRALREQERGSLRHLPIVAVTAHSREGDAEMCLAAGMDGFVSKPVREEELFQVMHQVLGWSDERTTTAQPRILNREGLQRRLGGRQDQLQRVIRHFLNELPRQLEEVYHCFSRSDQEGLSASLHRLKCSALAFESPRILEPIGRLEGAARRPLGLAESGAVLAELRRELDLLKVELIEVDLSLDGSQPQLAENSNGGHWPGLDRPLEVLLAEDNPINQTLVLSILEEQCCQVTVVENGQEALEASQHGNFDIILMDVQMPVMDGLEALSLLRQRKENKTPVLIMTATAVEGGAEEYLEAGADGFLGKPIQEDELWAAFERVLSQQTTSSALSLESAELLDVEALGERLHYKLERLARLSQVFHQVLPGHLHELRQAVESGDGRALEHSAHRYKTTLRSIEARRSLLRTQQLESLGREGSLDACQPLVEALCQESEEICARLEQLLAEAAVLAQL